MSDEHATYLEGAQERYREAYERVAALLAARFPEVERIFENEMPMWRIPRPEGQVPDEQVGTIDPAYVHVGLAERAAGLTLHLWYPPEYELIDDHAAELKEASLKPMKGCIQFNRKGPFPVAAIEPLLDHIHAADGF